MTEITQLQLQFAIAYACIGSLFLHYVSPSLTVYGHVVLGFAFPFHFVAGAIYGVFVKETGSEVTNAFIRLSWVILAADAFIGMAILGN